MEELKRRIAGLEETGRERAERLRKVVTALVSLAELPKKIDGLTRRFDKVVRLEERVERLESDEAENARDIDELKARIAKWSIPIGVLITVMTAATIVALTGVDLSSAF